ncbi:FadR family transcriptional regulator [Mumia zhuanghuii]|uniref:FadR family transcriptional regulator n=2 Tax=Mumia TaxID=1546255 RepID=A0A5Q6RY84_9ACTN|nr:FadR family transcriptional regulator [Mumia zhuanghuii]
MAGNEREPTTARAMPQPQRLNTPSVAEAVASQLRSRILDGDLVDGSELPPEATLLAQFPVSRPSLREAFRILETEGLITVRRGKRGGILITHPQPAGAAYHVGLLLHSRHTSLADLADARNLVEPLTAEQAARRRNHRRIGRELSALTREAEEQLEDGLKFTELSTQFHHHLVMSAGNETLQILVGVIEGLWNTQELTWAASAVVEGQYPAIALRREVVRAHLRISDAIEQGDADEALRLTRAHLKATSRFVASSGGEVRVLDEHGGRRQVPVRVITHG